MTICFPHHRFSYLLHCWHDLANWGSFWLDGRCHAWGKRCSLKVLHRIAGLISIFIPPSFHQKLSPIFLTVTQWIALSLEFFDLCFDTILLCFVVHDKPFYLPITDMLSTWCWYTDLSNISYFVIDFPLSLFLYFHFRISLFFSF